MRRETKVILLSACFGLFIWAADALVDWEYFSESTFPETLVYPLAPEELFERSTTLIIFLVFGIVMSRVLARRRRIEDALRRSEFRFRTIFDNVKDGIFIGTVDGRILDANPAACQLLGYSREELIGMTVVELLPPETASRMPRLIAAGTLDEGAYFETENIRKDGTRVPVEVRGTLVELGGEKRVIAVVRDTTERGRAEEALRLLGAVTEQVTDSIIVTNLDFEITYINRATEDLYGYSLEEVRGKTPGMFNAEPMSEGAQRSVYETVASGKTWSGWQCNRRKDGTTFDCEFTVSPLLDDSGRIYAFIGIQRDITARKREEARLRDRAERIIRQRSAILEVSKQYFVGLDVAVRRIAEIDARALDVARVGIWLFNEDRSRIDCIEEYRKSANTHRRGESLPVKSYPAYFKALESLRIIAAHDARTDPRTRDFTATYLVPFGITSMLDVPIRLHGKTIGVICHEHVGPVREWTNDEQDFAGSMSDMVSLAVEASERARAKEALRQSEVRYRTLLNNIPQKVFYKDLNSTYVLCNESFAGDLNISPEEIKGKTDYDFFPKEMAEKYIADDGRIMKSGRIEVLEETYIVGGQQAVVQTLKAPVRDDKGGVIGIFGIFWDITDRKRAEEQLVHAQKMQAVGTLAGGLAHDFNNILAGIMGYASLTKGVLEEGSPQFSDMEQIEQLAKRGAALTQALLTFSRKGEYRPRPLRINLIIEEVLGVLGRTAAKGVSIEVKLASEIPNVMGDEGQLNQVFMNLCLNACEAMPEHGRMKVETREAKLSHGFYALHPNLKGGAYVAVAISDSGHGMDTEMLPRIFEPFFTTKAEKSGTGLGLSIVSGIVEKHGGCIEVESEKERGSTFTVYLPATDEEVREAHPKLVGTLRGDETILLVDDEEGFRQSAGRWLDELGYETLEVASGEEAVEMVGERGRGIDLVVLDMVMEGMGGAETFMEMRKIVPDLPVIICTGYSLDAASRRILEGGADSFLQKPFDLTKLALKVRRVLDGR